MISEDFLQYLWKFKLFNAPLLTTDGEEVQIIKSGEHNHDSGPDFFNAEIKIGKTVWAGNVEIHIDSSGWTEHRHEQDDAYRNIILHGVFQSSRKDFVQNGIRIPEVEFKNRFNPMLWNTFEYLKKSKDKIPCGSLIHRADRITISTWLERMLVGRLENKISVFDNLLHQNKNDWSETFYQALSRNFGFRLNTVPFELLAKSLPSKILARQKSQIIQIEALLYGQAGLLERNFRDDYPIQLKREYAFLKNKFNLMPIEKHLWKFAKTRPVNFPTIRIAQFAMLIFKSSHLLTNILETKNISDIIRLFKVHASGYWNNHFRFDAKGPESEKHLGKSSIENILINTVAPLLFLYGKEKNEDYIINRSLQILEQLPPESNHIVRAWEQTGVVAKNAYETQALIELKNNYCNQKKCLQCAIGMKILSRTN